MKKDELIIRFKAACKDNMNKYIRRNAIETQFNRKCWEISDNLGLIRIQNHHDQYFIVFFPFCNSASAVPSGALAMHTFSLSESEYKKLELDYFGGMKSDMPYLNGMGKKLEEKSGNPIKHKVIEVVSGQKNNYYIYKSVHGFYAEVRSRSILKLLKEDMGDFLGLTSIHPQFFSNFYSESIESMRSKLGISINLENEENGTK